MSRVASSLVVAVPAILARMGAITMLVCAMISATIPVFVAQASVTTLSLRDPLTCSVTVAFTGPGQGPRQGVAVVSHALCERLEIGDTVWIGHFASRAHQTVVLPPLQWVPIDARILAATFWAACQVTRYACTSSLVLSLLQAQPAQQ